jgi:uncharacterized lipoprotein YddW (UPF0748 family)
MVLHTSRTSSLRIIVIPAVSLLLFPCFTSPAGESKATPPKREVRAVWIATASGLDWPKSLDKDEQQSSLRQIVHDLHAAHFNTIFFQVRARADAYYRSSYEPWAENLTGTLGQNPGWDPLEFILQEAHDLGMEVHAWFNVFKVRGLTPITPRSVPHITVIHPDWAVEINGESWLDPGIPEVRGYVLRVALELSRIYDLDGIQFDFMRYPGRDFPDGLTYRRFGGGKDRDAWRRSNINAFVREFYGAVAMVKPELKVGSAPVGIYDGVENGDPRGGYHEYYQDSQGWQRAGMQDYLAPQIYWDIGSTPGDPDFALLARRWAQNSGGRHIYIGIGAYKPQVAGEIPIEIDTVRASGAQGEAFFRLEHVTSNGILGNRYRTLANIPPMSWKDSIPPLPPTELHVSALMPNVFQLTWNPGGPARDRDRAWLYNIYRSTSPAIRFDDPTDLVATTTHTMTSFVDTIQNPGSAIYYFAVSALDRGNNESVPSPVASGVVREMLVLRSKLVAVTSLSLSLAIRDRVPLLAAFQLPERTFVSLDLFERTGEEAEQLFFTLLRGVRDGGTYVVGIRREQLKPGRYLLRLKAGDTSLDESFELRP